MQAELLVIGAGAAGLMAAGTAGEMAVETVLLERNDRPARKVMITGKGRCNVTNACDSLNELIANVPVNGRFLYSAFSRFMPSDTVDFFESRSVMLKKERGNRVFPVSDKAVDIVDALVTAAKKSGVKFINGTVKEIICKDEKVQSVLLQNGEIIDADACLIATGGMSYPLTGSTGDGYIMAEKITENTKML